MSGQVKQDSSKVISAYLDSLRQIERSSPSGFYWDRLFKMIVRNAPKENWPANPLILNGSVASHAHKHRRLEEHLLFAAKHGRLFETLAYLERMPDKAWNSAPLSTWDEEDLWVEGDW
ncbi:hypothetical protein D1224_06835 [Henriciella barbarensis]|uniref:Uncharacterized protein n=1 Tax=Henriciella barbarensis TaxID=86342 RepID=A0A399QYJ1_9PROT|nr:hypothetical protein D1224_06835 [Henriciella barbarensis]